MKFSVVLIIVIGACTSPLKFQSENIKIVNISPVDTQTSQWLSRYSDSLKIKLNDTLAFTDSTLNAIRITSKSEFQSLENKANLGRVVADYGFESANHYAQKYLSHPISFGVFNHGGIRNSIGAGYITLKSVFEVMPFENQLVLLQLNGQQLDSLFQYIGQLKSTPVSNIQLDFKIKTTNGVAELTYTKALIQQKEFDPKQTYWIVTTDFMANGGDKFVMLKYPLKKIYTGILLRDALIDGFKREKSAQISSRTQPRIHYSNEP